MGFDICGVKYRGKEPEHSWNDQASMDRYFKWQDDTPGVYFRNNSWWWRPLWEYVCLVCVDILSAEDAKSGNYNDGHLIDNDKTVRIADRLDDLLKSGAVNKYDVAYRIRNASMPDEVCWLCHGSGVRRNAIVNGKCNGCSGTGKQRPHECSYPFSEENVKKFSEFCRASGGFEIY